MRLYTARTAANARLRGTTSCERLVAALVRATPLARAVLILHAARWADDQRLPDGRIAPVRDVEITTRGLEDAFVALTGDPATEAASAA